MKTENTTKEKLISEIMNLTENQVEYVLDRMQKEIIDNDKGSESNVELQKRNCENDI